MNRARTALIVIGVLLVAVGGMFAISNKLSGDFESSSAQIHLPGVSDGPEIAAASHDYTLMFAFGSVAIVGAVLIVIALMIRPRRRA